MAKKLAVVKFIPRLPKKRPGSTSKPRGMKSGITGKQAR
jgi:hypothetical protein